MKVGIIGGGNLGSSLVRGFLRASLLSPDEILVSDVNEQSLGRLQKLGVQATTDNKKLVKDSDVVFIAVKPAVVESVLGEVKDFSDGKLFVSVAAGVPIGFIESRTNARVVRAMPNLCGAVAEMASCFCPGSRATKEDQGLVERLLKGLGVTFKVDEGLMDAVTGLSGSGPAYFYLFIRAMRDAAMELGLPEDIALGLAAQTARGAGGMVLESEESIDDLIRKVCTPKGTTIEGLKVLEVMKVSDAIKDAVKASARRAKELSRQIK